uniref:alkaline phosphatase n=1 Tax=Homalodisca liturata TaxID=320908 RepID=A0A1B6IP91_9HEMI
MVFHSLLLLAGTMILMCSTFEDPEFWFKKGRAELEAAFQIKWNKGVAKNVLLFVGDGMGINTITAARIYKSLENSSLVFENFPHIALTKTYCVDRQVPDSSSAANALFSGVKTNYETVGVDAGVPFNDCQKSLEQQRRLKNIITWAQEAGKDTGFVTTTRVTHATPSALYAHCPNRRWECEDKMPSSAAQCKDIARQLVEDEPGKSINVIMGGGRQCMMTNINVSESDPRDTWSCSRKDGRDLIKHWIDEKKREGLRHAYLSTTDDLNKLDIDNVDFVMGIFANGHLKLDHERDRTPRGMPSLSQMTETAIKVLLKNKKGFLLVVEGGMIDQSHHRGYARDALDETICFEAAVQASINLLKARGVLDSSLIIVTSDHGHSLAINGNPPRGNNILGISETSRDDGVPFTTLLYATGDRNNYQFESRDGKVVRKDPSQEDTTRFGYHQQSVVVTDEALHDGGDVPVYAMGPQAHLFHRVHEQTYVAHVIAYAAKIGHFAHSTASYTTFGPLTILLSCILLLYK